MGGRGWGPHVHDIHISSLAQGFLVALALCSSILGAHLGVFGHVQVLGEECFLEHQPLRGAKLTSASLHGRVNHRQTAVAATYDQAQAIFFDHLHRRIHASLSASQSLGPAITFAHPLVGLGLPRTAANSCTELSRG